MKILLVAPACGNWKGIGRKHIFNGKVFRFSMLPLLTVAGITPEEHQVKIIDEQLEDIPFKERFDLVGINCMAATAPRAFEIASYFQQKGIPVVLGGVHATLNHDQVLSHCDSVVVGPAFDAWPTLLRDLENHSLKSLYHGNPMGEKPVHLPFNLLKKSNYVTLNATYATLGCTNECKFCTVTALYKGNRYYRKIDNIVKELSTVKGRFILFIDDNLTQDREYALKLFSAIAPIKKQWATQASIEIANDDELLRSMEKSGCIGLFIGIETFSGKSLSEQKKGFNIPEMYKDAIDNFHRYGIFIEAGIVFGFEDERKPVFQQTLKMLKEIGVDAIQPSILTPLPGTRLFEEMKQQIVDYDLSHYDFKHAVFNPRNMSKDELKAGMEWVVRRFYSLSQIGIRLIRWARNPRLLKRIHYAFLLNMAYYGRVRRFNIKGYDPSLSGADIKPIALHAGIPSKAQRI